MIGENFLFFLPVIVSALVISYEDIKKNLIRNEVLIFLLVTGFVIQSWKGNLLTAPIRILTVFTSGALLSFLLWFLGLLSAGDSKLLTVLFLYFPLTHYNRGLPLDFMINIFVPVFVFLTLYLLIKSGRKSVIGSLKKSFTPYKLIMVVSILIGFSWLISLPLKFLGMNIGYLGLILITFLGYEILLKFSSGKTELVFLVLALIRLIFDYRNTLTLEFVCSILFIGFFFLSLRFFILDLSFKLFSQNVKIDNLGKGMVLAEGIQKTKNGYKKTQLKNASLVGYMRDRFSGFVHSLGSLEDEDVRKIKKLKEDDKLAFEKIKIQQKQPFSSFIYIGYILTFFMGTNFATFIKLIFQL